jgi:hypothetical protein
MPQSARYFWLLAGATSACAGAPSGALTVGAGAKAVQPPAQLTLSKPAPSAEDGPRLFPPLSGVATTAAGEERDGTRRLVAYGLRVLLRPSGAVELAREYLPAARTVQSLELPARLGSGFLFYVVASSATLFFRAASFTGDLTPFARLDFEVDQVIAGFDRVYLISHRPERLVALDAEHGTALGLGGLPPSPAYDKLAFVDAWFGAAVVPLRGTLVTFDAGASWRPLAFVATGIEVHDGALRLTGPGGVLELDANGTLTRRDLDAPTLAPENPAAQALRAAPSAPVESGAALDVLGRNALKLAVLRGFLDHDGSLVVANSGVLMRVRARDGKLLASDAHAYPGGGECSALPLGRGFGFACSDGADLTTLYTFLSPFGMRRLRSFSGARYVASSGNGALVIRGSCEGSGSLPGAYCIADNSQKFREIHVRGDLGAERVVALADGRVAVIVPPRLGAPGFLSLIDAHAPERRIELKLPAPAPAVHLLEKGLWLDGFVEQPSGLSGWVVGAEPFAGVRVALDGTVTLSPPENSIDRALLSGTHALLVARSGRARESSDSGFEWSDVELPPEFDASRALVDDARLQGCSELGCAFAGFVRLGFRAGNTAPRLRMAALPDSTPLPSPGGGRWLLHCEATGEVSEPALPLGARLRGPGRADDAATAPWAPFLELAPPALGSGEVGYDATSNEADAALFHGYVWGQRGADWARAGHIQLRALDRFRIQGGPFQSAVTRSPWLDATAAAESFGFDGTGNPVSWRAVLGTGQRSAAVLVSSHGLLDLLLFEEGKTVAHVPNAGRVGFNFGTLSSVVKVSDTWYASSFNENHALTVSRILGNHVERLAEYPDLGHDIASATLVRGAHGDELGIWVTGRGWHLFPIDPRSHAVQNPLSQSFADLAHLPLPCPVDADGFLLTGGLSLEPSLHFSGDSEDINARHVEAEFVWSARGLCTRALAADTESLVSRTVPTHRDRAASPNPSATVPLTLSERRPQGRRWGYLCAP